MAVRADVAPLGGFGGFIADPQVAANIAYRRARRRRNRQIDDLERPLVPPLGSEDIQRAAAAEAGLAGAIGPEGAESAYRRAAVLEAEAGRGAARGTGLRQFQEMEYGAYQERNRAAVARAAEAAAEDTEAIGALLGQRAEVDPATGKVRVGAGQWEPVARVQARLRRLAETDPERVYRTLRALGRDVELQRPQVQLPPVAKKWSQVTGHPGVFFDPATGEYKEVPLTRRMQETIQEGKWVEFSDADGHHRYLRDKGRSSLETIRELPGKVEWDKTVIQTTGKKGEPITKVIYSRPDQEAIEAHREIGEPPLAKPGEIIRTYGYETDAKGNKLETVTEFRDGKVVSVTQASPGQHLEGFEAGYRQQKVTFFRGPTTRQTETTVNEEGTQRTTRTVSNTPFSAVDARTGKVIWEGDYGRVLAPEEEGEGGPGLALAGEGAAPPPPATPKDAYARELMETARGLKPAADAGDAKAKAELERIMALLKSIREGG